METEIRAPLSPDHETLPLKEEKLGFQESTVSEADVAAGSVGKAANKSIGGEADALAGGGGDTGNIAGAGVLTDDLRDRIVRQVEYYFSDENLPTDNFLLKYIARNKEGFVPISVIATFRKMRKLVQDVSLIEAALRTSSQLVLNVNGKKVRRLHPLPLANAKEMNMKARTVIVENLPDDYSTANLQKIFANAGKINNITVHDPHAVEESTTVKNTDKAINNKLHALVEYETVEAAANAVATLSDNKNWRSGMRVEILQKWMGKYSAITNNRRVQREDLPKKKNNLPSNSPSDGNKLKSEGHHDEKAEKEEDDHQADGKGRRQGQYRGRGKVHLAAKDSVSKPLPGPKMPDGTRGFTMGRGKPFLAQSNTHVTC